MEPVEMTKENVKYRLHHNIYDEKNTKEKDFINKNLYTNTKTISLFQFHIIFYSPFLLTIIIILNYGNNTIDKINKNRAKNLCNIPVLTKIGAGRCPRATKKRHSVKSATRKEETNIDNKRVVGELHPKASTRSHLHLP